MSGRKFGSIRKNRPSLHGERSLPLSVRWALLCVFTIPGIAFGQQRSVAGSLLPKQVSAHEQNDSKSMFDISFAHQGNIEAMMRGTAQMTGQGFGNGRAQAADQLPGSADGWVQLGRVSLRTGQYDQTAGAWDRALRLGGDIEFEAWHELPFHSEKGSFSLSASEISFVNERGQKLFAVPPAQVVASGAGRIQNRALFRLRVAGKNYNFDFIPFGVACQALTLVECPPEGIGQQLAVGNYITQTIPKLASGALASPATTSVIATPAQESALPPTPSVSPNTVIMDEFNGSSVGAAYGIAYVPTPNRKGALFSREAESRIEYRNRIPTQGTLEWWVRVNSGYYYQNFQLHSNQPQAMIFSTDAQGGDVTWPGTAKLFVYENGDVSLNVAISKYDRPPAQAVVAKGTTFRFDQWHAIGISYGSEGEYIMVDGSLVASAPENMHPLGVAGNHQRPLDMPTIGETVSHFWAHHQYEGGFEGVVDRFRASKTQQDWALSAVDLTVKTSPVAAVSVPPARNTPVAETSSNATFGVSNQDGTSLRSLQFEGLPPTQLNMAICGKDSIHSVKFKDGESPSFVILDGKVGPNEYCLVADRSFLTGKKFLLTQQQKGLVPCDQKAVSSIAAGEKRGVHKCQQIGLVGNGWPVLVAEFDRRGADLLAALVLKKPDQLIFYEQPAKYDADSDTGWALGDHGQLDFGDPNTRFINVFGLMFALQKESNGPIDLIITRGGGEGTSFLLLRSSGNTFHMVAQGYQGIQ